MTLPNVDRSRESWYLFLFSGLCLAWLAALAWYEVRYNTGDGAFETALAIGRGMEAAVVVSAALTFTIVEGYAMLAERYLQRRYREGHQEGREEGREEGRREILERLREVAPPDRLQEVDRLIEEARKAMRNGAE